ncbi:hypothetical protein CK203_062438 [Vitis vinifera]|uniref:RNase H type-1 domain-containing protein n=1 Tax=Vitis vinifera TaxID=29760 RepID=A0A438G6H1_VITVI|nr:hypothetical protein CK203_062438 [Vitis vinifera]
MARLRRERVRARLTHTPFYYPVRPYTMSLADYFVRASEPHAPSDGIIGGLSTTQEAELQRLVQQLQLSDGAPGPSASVLIAPPSPDRTSLMTLCFPDEIDDHGTFAEIGDVVDGAVRHDEYVDEMLAMSLSQTRRCPPKLASPFDLFGVSVLEIAGRSRLPPLQRRDTEIVDFGTADQPRELRIGSDLSTDERDSLIQLLRSYLDVFAWSYEDMPGLDPSIVQHRLPLLPQARPVKQKLRRLHPRWSLQILMAQRTWRRRLHYEWGTYCYRVMPFGLKNAGATYQRAATTLFHDMMHRDVEFRLRLNPKKCTFGVTSGKLLGYMVSERGIEVDPDKIRAILTCLHRGREGVSACLRGSESTCCPSSVGASYTRPSSTPILVCLRRGLGCMLAQLDDSGKDRAIYYLNEDVAAVTSLSGWRMYFDGAQPFGYGIGVLLISPQVITFPDQFVWHSRIDTPATNNMLSMRLVSWIRDSSELGIRQMEVFGDSNLVLRQIQGEWKTRDVKLKPYHAYLELLVGRFDDLRYTHLPRAQNQFADALATLASMIDIPVDAAVRPLLIESRSAPAYCCLIDDVEPDDGLPWYHDIYHFLRLGVYPEAATAKDKRALRQLATRFVICGETLYSDHLTGCYYCVWTAPLPIG